MRRALQTHVDRIVVHVELVAEHRMVDRGHPMNGIRAPLDRSGLRPVLAQGECEGESFAAADARGRAPHDVIGDQVERADLVVVAPAAPVVDGARERVELRR
jgi:hypothetical protein